MERIGSDKIVTMENTTQQVPQRRRRPWMVRALSSISLLVLLIDSIVALVIIESD